MPIYEFVCPTCSAQAERLADLKDIWREQICDTCGAAMQRVEIPAGTNVAPGLATECTAYTKNGSILHVPYTGIGRRRTKA